MADTEATNIATSPTDAVAGRGPARASMPTLGAAVPLSSFIGRERELQEVKRLLSGTRMLTLTGPGGVGKTRLAIEVARDLQFGKTFADGGSFAGLAALADAALVPQGIAAALGIHEEAGRPILETLEQALNRRKLLLVLDNCEHLVEACAQVADALLRSCPLLTILATSRESLNIAGEKVWPVPPLSIPASTEMRQVHGLLECEAIRLFVERAQTAVPSFTLTDANAAAVAEICTRLDGLPLAIELAAARVRLLGADQIAGRLEDRFRLLTGGTRTALPRHQTIRALVDWSYELLAEQERKVFSRLGVFAGDWHLAGAEAVCGGDGIEPSTVFDLFGRLVDKSLVVAQLPNTRGEVRYRLLETLREYALERLTADGSIAATTRRHALYFLELAERAEARYEAGDEVGALSTLEPEHDNIRAALRHFLADSEAELAARMAGAVGKFWFFRGHLNEGRATLREVLAQAEQVALSRPPSAGYAKALHAAALMDQGQGDYASGDEHLTTALAIWRQLDEPLEAAYELFVLGRSELWRGNRAAARPLFLESLELARQAGNAAVVGRNQLWLAEAAFDDGDDDAARAWAEQALASADPVGSRLNASMGFRLLGDVEARQGNVDRAGELFEASLAHAREIGRWLAAWTANHLADLRVEQHDLAGARALLKEALTTSHDAGDRQGLARTFEGCARLASATSRAGEALRFAGAAASLRTNIGAPLPPAERATLERYISVARMTLGPRAADAAVSAGQALSVAQTIAEALDLLAEPEPGPSSTAPVAADPAGPLTPREREVAALVARGLSNRAIARELVITEATAERHIGNVFAKLGLVSRAQLAVWAVKHGLLQGNP
ncbi:MAG: LuxR C-terminal-related transcriptional regulator [Chloroflexi bacterium]|nr:LuxR C-terminal-related transcriptional regulator [Chloroflexota bacterium]